jgi:hypothetical protein
LKILEETFSPEGYQKAITAMNINHFLGEICNAPGVLNQYSYNFLLFGEPSSIRPWGWLLYGHHLCLSAFFKNTQIVLTPTFTGAEPNMIDAGPHEGTRIMLPEEELGLKFMQSLRPNLQKKAQVYQQMHDPAMPEGRWNLADQRHLCGAFQDNRVVPYEGIKVSECEQDQLRLLLKIITQFVLYLPPKARQNRLKQVEKYFNETYFCWIGGYGDDEPFYVSLIVRYQTKV